MPDTVNRFGLPRHIPSKVAKSVRQRCGFGCVVCGSAIYDYEHFDPEFKDAIEHRPEGIILLCPNHHRAKGSFVSRSTLEKYSKAPYCKSSGFSHTPMDISNLTINLGPLISDHCLTALEVNSQFFINKIGFANFIIGYIPAIVVNTPTKAIWFEPPEEDGAPLRLNLVINGPDGNRLAWIENNVWHGSIENFDITIVSGKERSKIKVVKKDGGVIVDLEFFPPDVIKIYNYSSHFGNKFVEVSGDNNEGSIRVNGRTRISGSNMRMSVGTAFSL